MPSDFQTAFAPSLARIQSRFGETAVYSGPDGTTVNGLKVRMHRNDPVQTDRGQSQTGEALVNQSDLPKPVENGRFTFSDVEVWNIETTPYPQNGKWVCTVSRVWDDRLMPRRVKQ